MTGNKLTNLEIRLMGVIVSLALIAVAFAHILPHSFSPNDAQKPSVELSAYALPDGTQPVLCLGALEDKDNSKFFTHCEVCRLASGFYLPNVPQTYAVITFKSTFVAHFEEQIQTTPVPLLIMAAPRAPPVALPLA